MINDSDLSQIVPNITVPTIIIWGRKDRILHVDNAHLFHTEIKGSKLFIFEESGHVSLLEIPQKIAKVIEKFINENESIVSLSRDRFCTSLCKTDSFTRQLIPFAPTALRSCRYATTSQARRRLRSTPSMALRQL